MGTIQQYNCRKELLKEHINMLDSFMAINPANLLVQVFGEDDKPKDKWEAAKWLKRVLEKKLSETDRLIHIYKQ